MFVRFKCRNRPTPNVQNHDVTARKVPLVASRYGGLVGTGFSTIFQWGQGVVRRNFETRQSV